MMLDQRVVTQLPLVKLWDANGELQLTRSREVGCEQVAELLGCGPVRFVIANCGDSLKWVSADACYRYWKEVVKPHLVEPNAAVNGFRPERFPDGYCLIGTEWGAGEPESVVLLEMYH